jgi:hypothetical protein
MLVDFTEEELAELRALVAERRLAKDPISRSERERAAAPRGMYLALTPPEGIPAPSYGDETGTGAGTWTGTGTLDEPGVADCTVYRAHWSGSAPTLEEVGRVLEVLNAGPDAVPGSTWIPVWQDEFGAWWSRWFEGGGGGGTLTVREQDFGPQVFNVDTIETAQSTGLYVTDLGGGDVRLGIVAGTAALNGYLAAGSQTTGGNKTFTTANYDIIVGDGINITDKTGAATSTASGVFKSETTILGASTLVELKDSTTGSLVSSVLTEGHGLVVLHGGLSAEYVTLTDGVGFGYRYLYSEPSTDDLIHEIRGTDFSSGARNSAYSVVIGSTRRKGGTATTGGLTFVGGLYISGTATGGSVAWGDITGTPTTLAGYGITDAASDAELAAEVAAMESYIDSEIAGLSSVYQPLDTDLTNIAALTTTSFGRGLLELADAAALLAAAGAAAASHAHAGEDITSGTVADARIASTIARDSEVTAAIAALSSVYQPLDADLTALAGLGGTNTIYYRSAANTWSPVTISTGLAFSGGNLTATGGVSDGDKGDITVSASGATWTIDNGVVTPAKMSDLTAASVLGRAAGTDGVMAAITAGGDGRVLVRQGNVLVFNEIGTDSIQDGIVTLAKMATQAANTIIANASTSTNGPTAVAISASQFVGRTASSNITGMTAAQATAILDAFVAAGGSAAKGLVPSPGATAYTNIPRLLGSQAAFVKPSGRVLGSPSYVAGSQSTTSTTPVGLTTAQTVSFTLDETCDVIISCEAACIMNTTSATGRLYINDGTTDHTVSVATVPVATGAVQLRGSLVQTSKAAGSYTYTLKFSVNSGQADFSARLMIANLTG